MKTLIRLHGCAGWSGSSLAHMSFCWFYHAPTQIINDIKNHFKKSHLWFWHVFKHLFRFESIFQQFPWERYSRFLPCRSQLSQVLKRQTLSSRKVFHFKTHFYTLNYSKNLKNLEFKKIAAIILKFVTVVLLYSNVSMLTKWQTM